MAICSIFQSVEFYVISSVIAAAVVALLGKNSSPGPARQYLLAGVITKEDEEFEPSVEFICCEDGSVILRRRGISGINTSGAVSLAIEVVGFDVKKMERVVEGKVESEHINTASFILDFLGREHYFISYESPVTTNSSSLFMSLTLNNREGNRIVKKLQ